MATAKRKQEELGDECDDQEQHDNDPCSDDDDAKRPRLDLHHQHISHHQLPHHRQWSFPHAASEMNKLDHPDHHLDQKFEQYDQKFDQKYDQKFDHFDACASESEIKDSKELDGESENNDLNSASTRSDDFEECKLDKSEKLNFSYARTENSSVDRGYDVGGYYFNSVYPEYLVPRTFCKESNDDVPCDLSNWQRSLKYDQQVSSFNSRSVEGDRNVHTTDNVEHTDPNVDQSDPNADQADQPINFAYYHF